MPRCEYSTDTVLFVGHFKPSREKAQLGGSVAGTEVQNTIIEELAEQRPGNRLYALSMSPHPVWPKGPIYVSSTQESVTIFPGYINLPLIKHILFALTIIRFAIAHRPSLIVQYNSYFFENLAICLLTIITYAKSVIFIQDVHYNERGRKIRHWYERIGIMIAKRFDLLVPISNAIISDFYLDEDKCFVFQGAATDIGNQLLRDEEVPLEQIAVYAGALSKHNGIDLLVEEWAKQKVPWKLHIFGRGDLESKIVSFCSERAIDNIVFHGFGEKETIYHWQRKARWNICLRYSEGIRQEYFFPSKFFNVCCANGAVVVNDFYGIPDNLREFLIVANSDLSELEASLSSVSRECSIDIARRRKHEIEMHFSWRNAVANIYDFFD